MTSKTSNQHKLPVCQPTSSNSLVWVSCRIHFSLTHVLLFLFLCSVERTSTLKSADSPSNGSCWPSLYCSDNKLLAWCVTGLNFVFLHKHYVWSLHVPSASPSSSVQVCVPCDGLLTFPGYIPVFHAVSTGIDSNNLCHKVKNWGFDR